MKNDIVSLASDCNFRFLVNVSYYNVRFVVVSDEPIHYVHFSTGQFSHERFINSVRVKNKNFFGFAKHPNSRWAKRLLLNFLNS